MKALLFSCAGILITSFACAADGPPPQGTSSVAYSTDKAGNKTVMIQNRSYLFANTVYLTSGPTSKPSAFLIVQDQTSTVQMLSDTPPAVKLKVQAWTATEDFPKKLAWTLETPGDSSWIQDRLFVVKREGFEDDFNTYAYFHLTDGKPAYISNTPLLTVYGADSSGLTRHIGFRDQFPDNVLSKEQIAKKIAGIVVYGDDNGVTKKIAIYGWPSDDKPSPPSSYLKYKGVRLDDRDSYLRENKETGTAWFSHFSAVIVLSEGVEVEIPFEGDAPQLDKAKLPKGYTLEEVK